MDVIESLKEEIIFLRGRVRALYQEAQIEQNQFESTWASRPFHASYTTRGGDKVAVEGVLGFRSGDLNFVKTLVEDADMLDHLLMRKELQLKALTRAA